jgi:hypothetical protein
MEGAQVVNVLAMNGRDMIMIDLPALSRARDRMVNVQIAGRGVRNA